MSRSFRLGRSFKSLFLLSVICAAVFGVLSAGVLFLAPEKISNITEAMTAFGQKGYKLPDPPHTAPNPDQDLRVLRTFSKVFVNIAKQTRPALVYIQTKKEVAIGRRQLPFPDDFFFPFMPPGGGGRGGVQQGAGSGFIVDLKNGYVVTNNHVVNDADDITVKTFDDKTYKAKVVGTEKSVDVAVLKLQEFSPGQSLKAVAFADSDTVEVGDWVVALGAPLQLPQTLTVGVVSALGRGNIVRDGAIEDFIQTDAAINPGNSGGPLLNLEGRVIGINTAIMSPTGAYAGIGFSVPSNMARLVAEMLINDGKVTRGKLGILGRDFDELSPDTLKSLNIPETTNGILVAQVEQGSPADKAGIKTYDVIQTLNGAPVSNFSQLRTKVAFTKPGTEVRLGILRDGRKQDVKVAVGTYDDRVASRGDLSDDAPGLENAPAAAEFGFALNNLSGETRKQLGVRSPHGVLIAGVEEGSIASMAGIRRGDVIVEINRKPMKNVKDAENAFKNAKSKSKDLLLNVERGGRTMLVILKVQ